MKSIALLGVIGVCAFGTMGCMVPLAEWSMSTCAEGELVGTQAAPGATDVVFRLPGEKGLAIRIPDDWRKLRTRENRLEDAGSILELEELLAGQPVDTPALGTSLPVVGTLDLRAATTSVVPTQMNAKKPRDPTLSGSSAGDYLAVVRFENEERHVLHVLFGYDAARFRWVRLSVPVDVGLSKNRLGVALLLLPFCVALDAVAISLDVVWAAAAALAGSDGGMVGVFTKAAYAMGKSSFAIGPTDQLDPVVAPGAILR